MDEKKYSQLYQALFAGGPSVPQRQPAPHPQGMLSLLLVPLVFLVLLFFCRKAPG